MLAGEGMGQEGEERGCQTSEHAGRGELGREGKQGGREASNWGAQSNQAKSNLWQESSSTIQDIKSRLKPRAKINDPARSRLNHVLRNTVTQNEGGGGTITKIHCVSSDQRF